jgi:disks large protein 1
MRMITRTSLSLKREVSSLKREVSSLFREISSLLSEDSSLFRELPSLFREISSMLREVANLRREAANLLREEHRYLEVVRGGVLEVVVEDVLGAAVHEWRSRSIPRCLSESCSSRVAIARNDLRGALVSTCTRFRTS